MSGPLTGTYTRLCFKDSTSNKFYIVIAIENYVVTNWGRVGSSGQSRIEQTDELPTGRVATREVAREKVFEKTAKGYRVTTHHGFAVSDRLADAVRTLLKQGDSRVVQTLKEEAESSGTERPPPTAPGPKRPGPRTPDGPEGLLQRASEDAPLEELLERWSVVSADWEELHSRHEQMQVLVTRAKQIVTDKLMGGA